MNKLKEIILTNFQCYKKLSIPIVDGFNCITGSNNEGKSSIIRAINWVLTNKPLGDWMRRRDMDGNVLTATVKFVFDDGVILKRVKGKDKNYYAIDDEEYHDFTRTGIPEQVLELLDINHTLDDEIDMSPHVDMQDAPPFLVHSKNTDKARAINVLTGMNIAENTIKSFNAKKLNYSREITFCNKKIDEHKETLHNYRYLDDLPTKKLKSLAKKLTKYVNVVDELKSLDKNYKESCKVVKSYEVLRKYYLKIESIEAKMRTVGDIKADIISLKNIKVDYQDAVERSKPVPEVDFDDIQGKIAVLDKKRSTLLKIRNLNIDYDTFKECAIEQKELADKLYKKFKGKVCPTCLGKGKL